MTSVRLLQSWRDRALRVGSRVHRSGCDVSRFISWRVGGGREFFERYDDLIIDSHKWVFIVGCNNSGTSLLQSLLASTGNFSTFPHEGQRYTRAFKRAEKRGHERVWTEYVNELRLTESDGKEAVPRLLHDWVRELPAPVNEVVVEKTTANAVRMRWLQSIFKNCYFIGLVRNGYAVAEGIRRKGSKSLVRGARHWNCVNRMMLDDAHHLEHYTAVRYEDIVNEPICEIERLLEFLEISNSDITSLERKIGNIRDCNDESISSLSQWDIAQIYHEAREMLERYGYSSSGLSGR